MGRLNPTHGIPCGLVCGLVPMCTVCTMVFTMRFGRLPSREGVPAGPLARRYFRADRANVHGHGSEGVEVLYRTVQFVLDALVCPLYRGVEFRIEFRIVRVEDLGGFSGCPTRACVGRFTLGLPCGVHEAPGGSHCPRGASVSRTFSGPWMRIMRRISQHVQSSASMRPGLFSNRHADRITMRA